MSDSRFHSAARVFLAAREMRSTERREFLEATCGCDASLRDAVESLLAGDEAPLVDDRDGRRAATARAIEYEDDSGGSGLRVPSEDDDEIPRFKRLERVGEGGFGIVFMAEQTLPKVANG